ncbi:MAG: DUF362 domain-containing protein [Acidobacteriota bacterium]
MLSRREFLRYSVLFALAGALDACQVPPGSTATAPIPTSTPAAIVSPSAASTRVTVSTATPAATMTATPVPPYAGEPYLVVARGSNIAAITRAAIESLGGISKFVKSGNDVILKPNICNSSYGPEYATTTNPEVMAELVRMCLEAGARRVRVMDQGFSGSAVEGYKKSGIRDAVEKAGGQMEIMTAAKYVQVNFPNARDIKTWKVYQDILKADVVINVPIAKNHNSARVTLAMKCLMGVIENRNEIHVALDQRIADLSTVIKPTLHIIDAVRVLTRNGPTGGSLDYVLRANTIIASHDPVAADAFATREFFQKQPEDIGYIKIGGEMGLGRYDLNNLRIKEVTA